ncbi:MAG: chorismate synthase [Succinivibrio sp.]|nr:chorismate synthase [Succinivibrio sp.]
MGGNTFGNCFSVTTCGESHGPGLMAIIDGCPPGIELSEADIQPELDRRRPGSTPFGTPRQEPDEVSIISGIFEGKTTGTPIGLTIMNTSQRSQDYSAIAQSYRPGHADYTYLAKYGVRDYRGGGRASARETAMRVAAGAVAKKVLRTLYGVQIDGCVMAIGDIKAAGYDAISARSNPFNFADSSQLPALESLFARLQEEQDSCGALIEVRARNVPAGWGNPVFGRLDAAIAGALMSINAVKGVEIGDGFALAAARGSQARDEIRRAGFLSNHSGGILGGISSGQELRARLALKPTSSIRTPGQSLNSKGEEIDISTKGRHDPCVGLRAVPIAEAMLALTLVEAALWQRAQCGEGNKAPFTIPAGQG